MRGLLQIGITGGIGAGKSLVTKIFHVMGVPIYDADSRARILMNTDPQLIADIKKEFGDEAYLPNGQLNRPYLSKEAFGNADKVDSLNHLVHPRVAEDYLEWLTAQRGASYVMKEAALLYETGSYMTLDKIIVVTAPESLRIRRVLTRDLQRSESDIKKIIANQLSEEEKAGRADFVVVNDETTMLLPQVLKLHETFSDLVKSGD